MQLLVLPFAKPCMIYIMIRTLIDNDILKMKYKVTTFMCKCVCDVDSFAHIFESTISNIWNLQTLIYNTHKSHKNRIFESQNRTFTSYHNLEDPKIDV